jgi:hypothetical protein
MPQLFTETRYAAVSSGDKVSMTQEAASGFYRYVRRL